MMKKMLKFKVFYIKSLKINVFVMKLRADVKKFGWLSSENDFGFIIWVYVMTILFILSDRASPMLHAGKRRLQK